MEAFSFRSNGGSTTSIKPIDNSSIKIFPNPAADHFTLTSLNPLEKIRILNLTGGLMKEFSTTEKYLRVSTDELPAGIYFVETVTAKKYSIGKLIVQ